MLMVVQMCPENVAESAQGLHVAEISQTWWQTFQLVDVQAQPHQLA